MALIPKLLIDPSLLVNSNGYQVKITDATGSYDATNNPGGYGSPNPAKSSITISRLLLLRYEGIVSPNNLGQTSPYIKFTQYKNTGSAYLEFDTNGNAKFAKASNNFIPFNAASVVPTGGICVSTGNILIDQNWNVNTINYQVINNTDFLLLSTDAFPDDVYQVQWDLFQNTNIASGSLVTGQDYIVSGTGDPVILYDPAGTANVYGQFGLNEVFTAGTNANWSIDNGTPQVYAKVATTTYYFLISNQSLKYLRDVTMKYYEKKCKCSADFTVAFQRMQTMYNALQVMVYPSGIQIQEARDIIQGIKNIYDEIINCYCSE